MLLKKGKYVAGLVLLIMVFESIGAAVSVCPLALQSHATIHSKASKPSVLASVLFEKTEEETEGSEEECFRHVGVALVDLTQVAIQLSYIHSPQIQFATYEQHYDVRPSLFTLHCVFLI